MAARKRNIFVVGLDDFNLRLLKAVRHADEYQFHCLLDPQEVVHARRFDMESLLCKATETLNAFAGHIDAVVGYWDFPTVLMMAVLRRRFGLRGPTLESVLKCEHKYWSRLEQAKVVPDHVPPFALVDPFDDDALAKLDLAFPFWIKPVKAHSSLLGFRVNNLRDFEYSIERIRAGIGQFARPLDVIMSHADLPEHIAGIHGRHCIAEKIISAGRQCTLEGYVFEGNVRVYGIVDSVRGRNRSSFERYEYPSRLPKHVQLMMTDIAATVIKSIGLDNSPFNMEFFYEGKRDRIWLLEINARISKSHSPLFDKVEGAPHKEVMIDVALGRCPDYPLRQGRFRHAAKFMPRVYGYPEDTRVIDAPDPDTVAAIEARFPGTEIQMHVTKGNTLGSSRHRDSYSTELATIFMGANTHGLLMRNYRQCLKALHVELEQQDETNCEDRYRLSA